MYNRRTYEAMICGGVNNLTTVSFYVDHSVEIAVVVSQHLRKPGLSRCLDSVVNDKNKSCRVKNTIEWR
jgi:hypothetical protein